MFIWLTSTQEERRYTVANMAATTTKAFVARLAGVGVFDPNGDQIGRVRDVVVTIRGEGQAPRVHGMVIEVPPKRRIFLPITRITGIESGTVVANGMLNLRRFEPRAGETLVVAELFDRHVDLLSTGENVRVIDIGIDNNRLNDWYISQLFVRKISNSRLRRRGETMLVDWSEVSGLTNASLGQPVDSLLDSLEEMKPADVATVVHDLPYKRQLEVAQGMDDDRLADILEELPDSDQVAILAMLDNERAADVLEEMDPDDAADLLGELTPERAEELLELVEPEDAEDLRRLLTYDNTSAGGIMTSDPVVLGPDATVAEGLARIAHPELNPSSAALVYVVRPPLETPTGRFLGAVHFQRMLREKPGELVSGLVDDSIEAVPPDAPLDEVVALFARYNLVSLPVVDENQHLLGSVNVDDVIDHMLPQDWRENTGSVPAVQPEATDG